MQVLSSKAGRNVEAQKNKQKRHSELSSLEPSYLERAFLFYGNMFRCSRKMKHSHYSIIEDWLDKPWYNHPLGIPANQKVASSIPSQGWCLCCGLGLWLGVFERQPIDVYLTHQRFPPSLPLPFPSLKTNCFFKNYKVNIYFLKWKDDKILKIKKYINGLYAMLF